MLMETNGREVISRGVKSQSQFGMRVSDSAHIFSILRDKLYADKVLAVLREYSTNAWDAHVEAGIPDRPIKVTLPTVWDNMLSIRDYGHGLSEQQVVEVYTQYGASTKRHSNDMMGCLGLGSKAAFSYTDSFTVTSWNGGYRRVYVAVLGENGLGDMNCVSATPCDLTETGVEIRIAVRSEDVGTFLHRADRLYEYFIPQPLINITTTTEGDERKAYTPRYKNGSLRERGYSYGVMGCVAYQINLNVLTVGEAVIPDEPVTYRELNLWISRSFILHFDVGEVSVSASREQLEYTPRTKTAIVRRMRALCREIAEDTEKKLQQPSLTSWQLRHSFEQEQLQFVFDTTLLAKIASAKAVLSAYTTPFTSDKAATFKLMKYTPGIWCRAHKPKYHKASEMEPDMRANTCFVFEDTNKREERKQPTEYGILVRPMKKMLTQKAWQDLQQMIKDTGLDGVPVYRVSELPLLPEEEQTKIAVSAKSTRRTKEEQEQWEAEVEARKAAREHAIQLKQSAFLSVDISRVEGYLNTYSGRKGKMDVAAFSPTLDKPEETDIVIVFDGVRPRAEDVAFWRRVLDTQEVARSVGVPEPRIFGYKCKAQEIFPYPYQTTQAWFDRVTAEDKKKYVTHLYYGAQHLSAECLRDLVSEVYAHDTRIKTANEHLYILQEAPDLYKFVCQCIDIYNWNEQLPKHAKTYSSNGYTQDQVMFRQQLKAEEGRLRAKYCLLYLARSLFVPYRKLPEQTEQHIQWYLKQRYPCEQEQDQDQNQDQDTNQEGE